MEFYGRLHRSAFGLVWSFECGGCDKFPCGFKDFDRDSFYAFDSMVWVPTDLAALVAIDYLLERGWTLRQDLCCPAFRTLYQSTQRESGT